MALRSRIGADVASSESNAAAAADNDAKETEEEAEAEDDDEDDDEEEEDDDDDEEEEDDDDEEEEEEELDAEEDADEEDDDVEEKGVTGSCTTVVGATPTMPMAGNATGLSAAGVAADSVTTLTSLGTSKTTAMPVAGTQGMPSSPKVSG